ncbi:unnamed protein product [Arctia plantaginis]|uniref:Uncharacterized protein n=1 Tax=Arctia plantaginis TaxID=874455 RepID=A0A8S1AJ82_ARCPL|nr:unnamed protein product [Arctia plantaginis]
MNHAHKNECGKQVNEDVTKKANVSERPKSSLDIYKFRRDTSYISPIHRRVIATSIRITSVQCSMRKAQVRNDAKVTGHFGGSPARHVWHWVLYNIYIGTGCTHHATLGLRRDNLFRFGAMHLSHAALRSARRINESKHETRREKNKCKVDSDKSRLLKWLPCRGPRSRSANIH